MFGTVVNVFAVICGSLIGMFIARNVPDRTKDTMMQGLGLATILIGMKMAIDTDNQLIAIISVVVGGMIGEFLNLDYRLNHAGDLIKKKFRIKDSHFITGFVSGCLLFCVGAMSIVGSIEAGLTGDYNVLFAKSVLDFFGSMLLASSFGIGVLFASSFVLIYQGAITLLAASLQNVLVDAVVNQMTVLGGLLILGLGFDLMGIKKLNVVNLLPAIFVAGILGGIL